MEVIDAYRKEERGRRRINKRRIKWCCERGLNSRPLPYQGSALPLSYRSPFSIFALSCAILSENRQENICIFLQENVSYVMTYVSYTLKYLRL